MQVNLFGTDSSGFEKASNIIDGLLSDAGIAYQVHKIHDISIFLEKGIESIPAVQVDGGSIVSLCHEEDMNSCIKKIIEPHIKSTTMSTTTRTLFPIDFSENSYHSLSYAMQWVDQVGGTLEAIHVYRPSLMSDADDIVNQSESEELMHAIVDKVASDLNLSGKVSIAQVHREGFAGEILIDQAQHADYIIMSHTGAGNNLKRFFGSVSGELIDHVDRPVLLIPTGSAFVKPSSILYAYDSLPSTAELQHLAKLANALSAKVNLIHISNKDGDFRNIPAEMLDAIDPGVAWSNTAIASTENTADVLLQFADVHGHQIIGLHKRAHSSFAKLFGDSVLIQLKAKSTLPLLIL